jgi:hypothetical protein
MAQRSADAACDLWHRLDGVDIAIFVLLMTARTSDNAAVVVSGFNAIRMIVPVAVPPLSLSILITGVLLGLGTSWG